MIAAAVWMKTMVVTGNTYVMVAGGSGGGDGGEWWMVVGIRMVVETGNSECVRGGWW